MAKQTENPPYVTVTDSPYKDGFRPALLRWNPLSEQYEIHVEGNVQKTREDAVAAAENWAKTKGCEFKI